MVAEQVLQRSDLIGTPLITRETNQKLGMISQLWVDIDQREVVALGLQNNLISGTSHSVQLSDIHWVENVISVNLEDAVEGINILDCNLINDEVMTETGAVLGRVRDFKFDISSGQIFSLIIDPPEIPWIPTRWIMTFELAVEEVVGSGPKRLIVFKAAQERLHQLNIGVLERLGFSKLLWRRLEEAYLEGCEESEPPEYEYAEEEYDAWDDD